MFNVSLKEALGLVVGVIVYKSLQTERLCGFIFLQ